MMKKMMIKKMMIRRCRTLRAGGVSGHPEGHAGGKMMKMKKMMMNPRKTARSSRRSSLGGPSPRAGTVPVPFD
jgi:hypothetical protein